MVPYTVLYVIRPAFFAIIAILELQQATVYIWAYYYKSEDEVHCNALQVRAVHVRITI